MGLFSYRLKFWTILDHTNNIQTWYHECVAQADHIIIKTIGVHLRTPTRVGGHIGSHSLADICADMPARSEMDHQV